MITKCFNRGIRNRDPHLQLVLKWRTKCFLPRMCLYHPFSAHHHHSFNVSVPLKVGRTAPMFVLFVMFLHSILFAGSALDSFQCLRALLILSFHVFFGLPRPRCPTTSNSVMLLIQPSFLTTCPNQRSRLYRNKVCMLLIPSFLRRESELMWSFKRTLHVHRIIARSLRCSLSRSLTLGPNTHCHTTRQCGYTCCIFAHV